MIGVKTGLFDNNYNFTVVKYIVDDFVETEGCKCRKKLCLLTH